MSESIVSVEIACGGTLGVELFAYVSLRMCVQ